ncbi:hypothetical protein ABH313_18290 [Chromobacterium vaccinii]|uniref:hypothetical protein n=1 Tax=Chromobacterium vaccinii TaxID=1108595 RepID=UPI00326143E2
MAVTPDPAHPSLRGFGRAWFLAAFRTHANIGKYRHDSDQRFPSNESDKKMNLIKLISPFIAIGLAIASPLSHAEPEDQPLPGDFQPAPAAKPLHQPRAKAASSHVSKPTAHAQGKTKAPHAKSGKAHAKKHAAKPHHAKSKHAAKNKRAQASGKHLKKGQAKHHAQKKAHKPAKAHKHKVHNKKAAAKPHHKHKKKR